MTYFLLVLAVLLAIVGIIGAIVPALPGPPIGWAGLLLAYLAMPESVGLTALLVWLSITVGVTVLDYFAPALMTRLGGGSPAATTGATVGTIAGLFLAPWGLILGPLVGAFVGEYMHNSQLPNRLSHSLRIAALSFVGFILTTGAKLITCLWMTWLVARAIFALF